MDLRIGQLGFIAPPGAPKRAPAPAGEFALPPTGGADIPALPPPEVLRQVEEAGRRADELWHARRELHFQVDDDSGRVIVQVRDLEGNVIRTIPPSETFDILAGRGV